MLRQAVLVTAEAGSVGDTQPGPFLGPVTAAAPRETIRWVRQPGHRALALQLQILHPLRVFDHPEVPQDQLWPRVLPPRLPAVWLRS